MNIKILSVKSLDGAKSPVFVNFMFKDDKIFGELEKFFPQAPKMLKDAAERKEFVGDKNQTIIFTPEKKGKAYKLVLIGLGEKEKFEPNFFYQCAGTAARIVQKMNFEECLFSFNGMNKDLETIVFNVARGVIVGAYQYDNFMSKKDGKSFEFKKVEVFLPGFKGFDKYSGEGVNVGNAVNTARYLADTPANIATPDFMAREAKKIFLKNKKVSVEILGKKQLEKLKMNAHLGVGGGSKHEPRFVVIKYLPVKTSKKAKVFVGKGLTFDSGGISIKPSEKMDEMKYDMAGGATVIGALKAISDIGLKSNVIGVVPLAENLPSGTAIRPGDVLRSASGKTIEIANTDAEGRVVLSDALWYAQKFLNPEMVIDLATLTGACLVALSTHYAGFMHNDEKTKEKVFKSADMAGEKIWEMPLSDEFRDQNKSDIADIKNIGGREGGTVTAGAFLEFFIDEGTKWAHLDIAGTAWTTKEKPWMSKGAVGFGVCLLTKLANL